MYSGIQINLSYVNLSVDFTGGTTTLNLTDGTTSTEVAYAYNDWEGNQYPNNRVNMNPTLNFATTSGVVAIALKCTGSKTTFTCNVRGATITLFGRKNI